MIAPTPKLRRLSRVNRKISLYLPTGIGCYFPSCWDGTSTRIHSAYDGTPCPNCGREDLSSRFQSIHLARWTKEGINFVACFDHRTSWHLSLLVGSEDIRESLWLTIADGKLSIERYGPVDDSCFEAARSDYIRILNSYFRGKCEVYGQVSFDWYTTEQSNW
jgi:hypothetical protein